jgi:hypothetical protein
VGAAEGHGRRVVKLLTTTEVAVLLGVSEYGVQQLAREFAKGNPKGLQGIKVLREWRFTEADIAQFVSANRARPAQPTRKDRIAHRSLKT